MVRIGSIRHAGVMPQLPSPFRAALGVISLARDTIRDLPDKAIELPMLAVSTALQMSLRAQQRYAALTARGDDLLSGQRPTDEPPPWARFDDPVEESSLEGAALRASKTVRAPRTGAPSAFDEVDDSDDSDPDISDVHQTED